MTIKTFNFSANALDYGNYTGETQEQAQEAFAQDAGYRSWAHMVAEAEEHGGSNVEVREAAPSPEPVPDSPDECEFGDEEYQWRLHQAGL